MGLIGALADDYATLTCVKQHPNSALPRNQEHLSQQMYTFPPQRKTCETNASPPRHIIVTVWGSDILFSIIYLPPLSSDSPFTFTVSIMFFIDTFRYTVW